MLAKNEEELDDEIRRQQIQKELFIADDFEHFYRLWTIIKLIEMLFKKIFKYLKLIFTILYEFI